MTVALLLVVALAILAAAAFVAVLLWRAGPWGLAALAAAVGLLSWAGYRAANPEAEFYRDLFQDQTGLAFPEDGRFAARAATGLVLPGDACAAAVVQIDEATVQRLLRSLDTPGEPISAPTLRCGHVSIQSAEYRAELRSYKDGSAIWWGVSHDSRRLAYRYTMMSWL